MFSKRKGEPAGDLKAIYFLFLVFVIINFLPGCGKEEEVPEAPSIDSTAIKDSIRIAEEERRKIKYHYFPAEGRTTLTGLKAKFNDEELKIILAVNRLDARNFRTRDSVVVPDTFVTDFLRYSPFPEELEIADSIKKLILISHRVQAFGAYEYGNLVKWGPTSLGKKSTPTPNGLYHTNWKAKSTISTINAEWVLPWAFNLDNFEGVSLHEFDLPGYPASHACARLLHDDAYWIYYWAEQWILTDDQEDVVAYGTPTIIFGKYNFGSKPPWHFLPSNPDTTSVSFTVLNSLLDEHLDTIIERQVSRDSVVAERIRLKEEKEKQKASANENKNKK